MMFEDLLTEYERLEPPGTDAWNPLLDDIELWHRVRLFIALGWALRQIPISIEKLKVLDVGCGVGRSTRTLLEFGVIPENILGIDLRSSAISYAQSLNPGISFQIVRRLEDWPSPGTFDLSMQCTVFTSILGMERRIAVAEKMEKSVHDQGYIFWWDGLPAANFAGGDSLRPEKLFLNSQLIGHREYSLRPFIPEALRCLRGRFGSRLAWIAQHFFGFPPTHCAALFQKMKANCY
jgi:SAM-dependent methyltransferase